MSTNKKYEVHNQLTGLSETAIDFSDIKIIQARVKQEYMVVIESLFEITVLVENEDGSWTQSVCDKNGEAIIQPWEMLPGEIPVTIVGSVSSSGSAD
jgi:hypothetical protein